MSTIDLSRPENFPVASNDENFAKLRSELVRAVARICPRWLADGKEDIVQVAMMRVMNLVKKAEQRSLTAAYLRKVAYSALIDEIRRIRRRQEIPLESDEDSAPFQPPSTTPQADHQLFAGQIREGIRSCLQRFRRSRRLALTLYLLGHSVPEAAEMLSWGAKKTENLVYRGLADLRQCLTAKGLEP